MMYGLGRFKSFFYYGKIKKKWSKIILDHNANACIIFLVNMSTQRRHSASTFSLTACHPAPTMAELPPLHP
jgi:hypothetical protein